MQKHKFNTGDIVRLKPDAKNWASGVYNKDHVYGENLIAENGHSVRHCVNEYPDDFILVKKNFTKTGAVDKPQPKPHKHAELIKKWADGANIEYYDELEEKWYSVAEPSWYLGKLYREAKEREFPKTSLQYSDLYEEYKLGKSGIEQIMRVANLAIKQYILDTENAKTI